MITVAGSINLDVVARVPHIPAPGETVLGHELLHFHGGKGANQAVAAARLQAPVHFFGAVGDDAAGEELAAGLQQEGIDTTGLVRRPGASGHALINVADSGENAISVLSGANREAPLPPRGFASALTLLQLEIPLPTVLAWAQATRATGGQVLLNAAPMAALPAELLAAVNLLVVNRGELQQLAGSGALREALATVAGLGPARIVVTLGSAGCLAWDAGHLLELPGRPVTVIDSTGAGDCFVGALAAALHAGAPFTTALAHANLAAALSCTRAGARAGMPTLAEQQAAGPELF